jgi:hypothetical protein
LLDGNLFFDKSLAPGRDENMSQGLETPLESFVDRRSHDGLVLPPACERRQFANSYDELSPEASELARAIDGYKLHHRRRFITYDEMLAVIKSLGYRK